MTDFEKSLSATLAGKPPESTSEVQFDLCQRSSCNEPAMLKRNLTIIVGAVLIDEKKNVLLIQEAKEGCRGKWYLPAGRLEENETIEEGVKREVKEESGLQFEPTSLICVENYPSRNDNWIRFTFTGKITGGKLKTKKQADKESIQAEWFPVESLRNHEASLLQNLRARDILVLIEACETHKRLASVGQARLPVLPTLQCHKHMSVRLMLARKLEDKFEVLISRNGQPHLPVFQNARSNLPPLLKVLFGSEINILSQKGVLCVEHLGKSRQIFADGVCLTILVFTTTDKNPKEGTSLSWHTIQDASIASDLDRRIRRPESSILLRT